MQLVEGSKGTRLRFSHNHDRGFKDRVLVPEERRKRAQEREGSKKKKMKFFQSRQKLEKRERKKKKKMCETAGRAASCSPKQQETCFNFNRETHSMCGQSTTVLERS